MLRVLNGGESHGKMLVAVVEGVPAGLPLLEGDLNVDLARRQRGYGRGGRMRIEKDEVEIVSGVRKGKTLGSPVSLLIRNKDWTTWQETMSVGPGGKTTRVVTKPRPGHADLAGAMKYDQEDIRNVLEKASARETAIRVAVGGIGKKLLSEFGVKIWSHVLDIGGIQGNIKGGTPEQLHRKAERSEVRVADPSVEERIIERIHEAKKRGDTVGGVFEILVTGCPVGLGSYAQWDRRLNARLSFALMSIQAIKGVEVGLGFEAARRFGSQVHDEIFYRKGKGFYRKTNNAGGFEGGMTNGQTLSLKAAMKPISTLYKPLHSVDIHTKQGFKATVERSDICAVPAASVVGESVVAFELASVFTDKFGCDTLGEMQRNHKAYIKHLERF